MAFRVMDGECILVPRRRGVPDPTRVIRLAGAAASVWLQLERAATTEQLLDALLSRFRVTRERAETDLTWVLDRLRALDVVMLRGSVRCATTT